jgi:DNA polymerase III subunit epsilon
MSGLLDSPLAFVDLETTGGRAGLHRVIEVGVVAARAGRLESEWSTLVNPGVAIPPGIQHFTGITDEMVRSAPFFEDIAGELLARLEGRLFVAHNARFDYGFLRAEFRRLGQRFSSRVACTVRLSRRLDPEERFHNLDVLIDRHRLDCPARHRALADAQAIWQLWARLRAQRPAPELEAVLAEITALPSLPAHLPPDLADDLPEVPGVYRFYGEGDALLYVGKANDIRRRVLSHWQAAARTGKARQMAELTRRVEWTQTAGELGAELLEARLVRELQPLFNRRLRGAREVLTWVVGDDGAAPVLAPVGGVQLGFAAADTFGLFRSAAAARKALTELAREHRLCLKVLGLEDSAGSCFAHQLGRCAGACVGSEPLARHGLRVKLALAATRLKNWPFRGAVALRERGADGLEHVHVVDEWRHLATLEAPGEPLPPPGRRVPLDVDVYHILARHLAPQRLVTRRLEVVPLPATQDAA